MKRIIKVLVAEDDKNIREGLIDAPEPEGFEVKAARDGREAIKYYAKWEPDLLILDVMMPYKSGYDVCREIRRGNARIPVIMLTAKGEEIDKVLGLELGADDYITKPFGVRELLARIKAVCRRAWPEEPEEPANVSDEDIIFGDITVDIKKMTADSPRGTVRLSKREIALLRYFSDHEDEVLERDKILAVVWGNDNSCSRTLDQHIAQLRKKIEPDPKKPLYIKTVHGSGYIFNGFKRKSSG